MSKNTVSISHASISGSDLFLSGSGTTQTPYSGSGTPWSTESTSPYELSLNDTTGNVWVPLAPEPVPYLAGGLPYGLYTVPLFSGYAPVTETIGVQMRGTTKDNAIFLLRQLRNVVNAAASYIGGGRPILTIKGGTSNAYYLILGGSVQETPKYIEESTSDSAATTIRATLTWTRVPFGGRLTTPETLVNAAALTNAGGSNTTIPSQGAGDMIQEGSPLNFSIRTSNAGSGDPVRRIILATGTAFTAKTLSSSNTWNTSGTTYATGNTIQVWANALSMSQLLGNYRLRFRLFGVCTATPTGVPEFRWTVYNSAGATANRVVSGVIPAVNGDGHTTTRWIDSGPIPVTVQELRNLNDMNWSVDLNIRSADGAATTGTLNSVEALFYYDLADIRFQGSNYGTGAGTNYDMNLSAFSERTGSPCLPLPYPQAMLTDPGTSNRAVELGEVRGTPPRYYQDCILYARLLDTVGASSGLVYTNTSRTFTVTATHAPLYRTLRGNG